MSILSDWDIRQRLADGDLTIDPAPTDAQIQPASIDVTIDLSSGAWRPVRGSLVKITPEGISGAKYDHDACAGGVLVLAPGDCALVAIAQHVVIPPDLSLQVDGRSSIGRLFLAVHVTAGWCDAGFKGRITLELVNHGPFAIHLGDGSRIAQLKVCRLTSEAQRPYGSATLGSHYQDQREATRPAQIEEVEV